MDSDRAVSAHEWLGPTIDGLGDGLTVLRAVRDGDTIRDWVVIDANELVRSRWSWVVGEIVGMQLSELDLVADNRAIIRAYEDALATMQRQVVDFQLTLPGGAGGWRQITVIPVDADTVSVLTRDITRERYFENAAAQQRNWLSTLAGAARSNGWVATPSSEARFMRLSALILFVAAGFVTLANASLNQLKGVDVTNLRIAATVTMVVGVVYGLMPWERHPRRLAQAVVLTAIALLGVSDHFDHYSHAPAALAIYPVFFIMTVAWGGLTLGRGAATATALACAPVLAWMFTGAGDARIGLQCALVVLPAAAMLGEVLSWSSERAAGLIRLEAARRLRDPLTGLANRTQLSAQLDQALARSRRTGETIALLFVDLDRFKQVNDTLGHAAGDELLVGTGQRIAEAVRAADTVARLGGDEFVILCESTTAGDASRVAARIIEALHQPFHCEQGEACVGASIGIVHCADGSETAETMLQKADIAMYRAKARGRGCAEIFDEEMQHWVSARAELETALRSAVANDELRLMYQPVVDTENLGIVGFEALVRWARPGFGLLSPADFIPCAEESDLIVEIGGWVLHAACRQAAEWAAQWPERRLEIAVNVSSRQLARRALVQQVTAALAASGLDPSLLVLELTESTLIDDGTGASSDLEELRRRGIRIAVDDFGTGYSSLTYLRSFPIDVIKVDRTFVDTMAKSRGDMAIVAAVLALARNLGLAVVAEGVETNEQLAALVYLNCRLVQGYLFSRPVAASDAADLVDRGVAGALEASRAAA